MNDHWTSINETAAIFNIPAPSRVYEWLKTYEAGGVDALISKKKGSPSMKKENHKPTQKRDSTEETVEALQKEL
ncbi:helix-turn-helix domain-containing protein [Robertmurraya siralis]|uniref:helix-turn-helix domain-containing protein n=1 Tax=Robertmurraya siralis TaxID=77777 RepID=UPI0038B4FEDB